MTVFWPPNSRNLFSAVRTRLCSNSTVARHKLFLTVFKTYPDGEGVQALYHRSGSSSWLGECGTTSEILEIGPENAVGQAG